MNQRAFTIIELVFVIVILGILAAVAIPRLASTVNDANIGKGRSDVAAIRSAIVSERQSRLLQGQSAYINHLDHLGGASNDGDTIFDDNGSTSSTLLQYGIVSGSTDGHWRKTATDKYQFKASGVDTEFTYTQATGRFDCVTDAGNCNLLTQ